MLAIDVRGLGHSESFPVITCLPVLLRVLFAVPHSGENRDARQ